MPRVRLSTTVDEDLLTQARNARRDSNDAAIIDEALRTFVARNGSIRIDAEYATAYARHPVDEPDAWGDLASFRDVAGAT